MTEDEMYDIICGYEDSEREYHELNIELEAENAKLRERVAELDELLPENGRWFSAEIVEAYVAEIAKLRELSSYAIHVLSKNGLNYCANEMRNEL